MSSPEARAIELAASFGHLSADQLRLRARDSFQRASLASEDKAEGLIREGEAFRLLAKRKAEQRKPVAMEASNER
jgi:hypothetical protein